MRSWILAFLAGVLALQFFSHLPNGYSVASLFAIFCLCIMLFYKHWHTLRIPFAFLCGFTWCFYCAHTQLAWALPENLEGKTLSITGYIASIPNPNPLGSSFLFQLKKIKSENTTQPARGLIRLTWRNPETPLHVGDEWNLSVHLKKIHGTLNPGGFDYEAFALQEGIHANGYIIIKLPHTQLSHHWYHRPIDRMREYLKHKIAENLPTTQTSPWITALAIGERHDINANEWQVLRNTGTNHLMAIAGLHIGFMAALAHFLVTALWRRVPALTLKMPAQHAGAIAALIMALIYSAMAGFSIPTQRACLMLFVFLFTLLMRRQIGVWHAWCTAIFVVLVWNPLSVLTESFWLSFGSVALIIYGVSGRILPTGWWWKWGRIQWVIAIGLIPLSMALFQQCSFISFAANSIAIPGVAFIVVPLVLLGCFLLLFSAKAGGIVLILADKVLSILWKILTFFAHLPGFVWYQSVPHGWMLAAALVGVLMLLLPIGFPGRYLGVIWVLPLILYKPVAPKENDVWFSLLDVGQGLSAIVQTQHHVLVFDTGPRMSASFDMGESVVVPFLHVMGTKQIDMVVISHGDNDHIGGVQAVLKQFPVSVIKTSVPEKFVKAEYCLQGTAWNWDGVHFEFIYPTSDTLHLGNDSSCVLRVTSHGKHILLTGDVEKFAERSMLSNVAEALSADIIVAPHHGSKTSGLIRFVAAVNPHFVLYPIGYRNRYHFPHRSVVAAYHDLNAIAYDTAHDGAIQFQILTQSDIALPSLYREVHKHYWNN